MFVALLGFVASVIGDRKEERDIYYSSNYNIARAHPNLISIGVIMVHFSTYARPCVHPMTCASQVKEACARYVIKKLFTETQHRKNVYL